MRAEVAAVSCPACGAGLQALGGGRVVLQVCAYCGAELDAVDNYRLLRTHAERRRPNTPFALGAKGRIEGIDWTVIGILGWSETYAGLHWGWIDHQLYSPTHGYAWLTLESGVLILTRAWRGGRNPAWITSGTVESAEHRPEVYARSRVYRYYETSDATVTAAEGEFSAVVRLGDRVRSLCFLSVDEMLTMTLSGEEREVELSSWLPQAETWASFGLTPPEEPWRVHPLQPYRPWKDEVFLSGLGLITCVTALALSAALMARGEPVSPLFQPNATHLALDAELPITKPLGLTELRIQTDLHNAWSEVELELVDPKGSPVFEALREIGYYEGFEDGESWSEGSSTLSIAFRPLVAGAYDISIDVPGGGTGENAEGSPIRLLHLSVMQGKAASFWMWFVFFASVPLAAVSLLRQGLHRKARWRGSDWSED